MGKGKEKVVELYILSAILEYQKNYKESL